MAALLRAVGKQGNSGSYIRRLLAAFGPAEGSAPVHRDLIDPLSARELDVLRLLGTDLDGPGIARELVVSLNTVRTHQEHLRQARRDQPPLRRAPWRQARPDAPPPRRPPAVAPTARAAGNHHVDHHTW